MNKKLPLVSIIMNSYNGEKYLLQTLKSIIGQTYKNWELIFYDNFSTDNSLKIIKKLNNKKIKYFYSKKHLKLYHARNEAIKRANGKYICFLDTDDWWSKSKLQKQIMLFLNDKKVKFVYSNYYLYFQKKRKKKIFSKNFLPEGYMTQKLLDNYCTGILTVMLKKEIFIKDIFNKSYNIIGDFEFFLRLSKKYKFKCIQQPLAYYRVHNDNYSRSNNNELIVELSTWLKIAKNRIDSKKYSFKKVKIIIFKHKLKQFFNFLFSFKY